MTRMIPIRLALPALALTVAAGCTPPTPEPIATPFGEAVRKNIIVQVVNPEGPPPLAQDPGFDGSRAALMQRRYQADKVEEPRELTTSTVILGGGGGDGGN